MEGKVLVSWVGLRGSVPIVLATFPLLAGVAGSETIFNIVFFIVLTSTLLQGWSIPVVARLMKLQAPLEMKRHYPIEFAPIDGVDTQLVDFIIPFNAAIAGKAIVELGLPPDSLIVLVNRDEKFFVPSGGTVLEGGDVSWSGQRQEHKRGPGETHEVERAREGMTDRQVLARAMTSKGLAFMLAEEIFEVYRPTTVPVYCTGQLNNCRRP
jgi:cell volume regulation protein A